MIDPMRGNNGPRYRHLAEDGGHGSDRRLAEMV